jgi:uncharacterized protein
MSSLVVDFHVHIFPDLSKRVAAAMEQYAPGVDPDQARFAVSQLRRVARTWLRPLTASLHESGTLVRHLPETLRKGLDELTALTPVPGLLLESTGDDLLESMEENEIDLALVIPHPPTVSNDFVLETCAGDERLLPVAYVPRDATKPLATLKNLASRGARALKIHPAADGEGPASLRYKKLLKAASDLELPVIIHTGCMHSKLLFKDASQSDAALYAPWFKAYPGTPFILAHMNWHAPHVAMDLANEYPNVYVDTSWQPSEVIGEAVRRMGPERILFGSDWPLVGNNISVGLERIRECVRMGLMTDEDARQILGENARRLLKLGDKD